MRKELKNFDWHVYGLSITDYDYTKRLIEKIIRDRNKQIETKASEMESRGIDAEAIEDLYYYSDIDNLFIYHFGIWRIQGIFEGILKQEFFPSTNLFGLKSKLDFVRNLNSSISDDDYRELLEWAKLRNALSHFPPEQYRPSPLTENDFVEYYMLVKKMTKTLLQK